MPVQLNLENIWVIMAGDFIPESELNLKGIHKYYNSYTLRGRFNWVITTYGSLLGLVILYKLLKPASKTETKVAEIKVPETKVAGTKFAETKVAETKVPETKVPETKDDSNSRDITPGCLPAKP